MMQWNNFACLCIFAGDSTDYDEILRDFYPNSKPLGNYYTCTCTCVQVVIRYNYYYSSYSDPMVNSSETIAPPTISPATIAPPTISPVTIAPPIINPLTIALSMPSKGVANTSVNQKIDLEGTCTCIQ